MTGYKFVGVAHTADLNNPHERYAVETMSSVANRPFSLANFDDDPPLKRQVVVHLVCATISLGRRSGTGPSLGGT